MTVLATSTKLPTDSPRSLDVDDDSIQSLISPGTRTNHPNRSKTTSVVPHSIGLPHEEASWRQGTFADWTIDIGSCKFPVHRYVLGMGPRSSPFFYGEFVHALRWNQSPRTRLDLASSLVSDHHQIQTLDQEFSQVFQHILEYMYEGNCTPDQSSLLPLLRLADFLQLYSLVSELQEAFVSQLSVSNAHCFLMECQRLGFGASSIILAQCLNFIARHFSQIDTTQLRMISPQLIGILVTHSHLDVTDASHVAHFLTSYIRCNNFAQNSETLLDLMGLINELQGEDALYLLQRAQYYLHQHSSAATPLSSSQITQLAQLSQKCLDAIAMSMYQLDPTQLLDLSLDLLLNLLSNDHLHVTSEDEVFHLISAHLGKHEALSPEDVNQLWSCCRFAYLSSTCLVQALSTPSLPPSLVATGAIAAKMLAESHTDSSQLPAPRQLPQFNATTSSSLLSFRNQQRSVQFAQQSKAQHATALGQQQVQCPSSMYWEMQVAPSVRSVQGMYVGMVQTTSTQTSAHVGSSSLVSWAFQLSTGKKFHAGRAAAYADGGVMPGDTVGMHLHRSTSDPSYATLTFYKNGVSCGEAFGRITGKVVPAVTLYRRDQQVTMTFRPRWKPSSSQ